MIRDLVEQGVSLVREEMQKEVLPRAEELAEERLLDLLLPGSRDSTREKLRGMLRAGGLDERQVEMEVQERSTPTMQIFGTQGMEEMGLNLQEMIGNLPFGKKAKKRKMGVIEAHRLLAQEEAEKLVDRESVVREALERVQSNGIVFIDEIDKVALPQGQSHGPDVSRGGVQRDLLPLVEGSTVNTKYGPVKTDHVLFIAAGAFHVAKVSDLLPELQGRFPIRVELEALSQADLVRILAEPRNALTKQYAALLGAEGVELVFDQSGIDELARVASEMNTRTQNIGARRLHTVLEKVLEEVSFSAPELTDKTVRVDASYVRTKLDPVLRDEDLSRYIL
jgi:ATP-dependent HslUV protease ATP-binding subunit HslU